MLEIKEKTTRKVVHLTNKHGDETEHEYFGSLEALFARHDKSWIGCSMRTLKTRLYENACYEGEFVTIRLGRLWTKADLNHFL